MLQKGDRLYKSTATAELCHIDASHAFLESSVASHRGHRLGSPALSWEREILVANVSLLALYRGCWSIRDFPVSTSSSSVLNSPRSHIRCALARARHFWALSGELLCSETSHEPFRSGSAFNAAGSSRTLQKSGLIAGRQAEMTATEHSTDVQMAEGTSVYVGSWSESWPMVVSRITDVMQTLVMRQSAFMHVLE